MILEIIGPLDDDEMDYDNGEEDVPTDSPTYPASDSEITADLHAIEMGVMAHYVFIGGLASQFYEGLEPAGFRMGKKLMWKGDPDILTVREFAKERYMTIIEEDVFTKNRRRPQGYFAEQLERVRFAFKDDYVEPRILQGIQFAAKFAELLTPPSASNQRSVGHLREPTASILCVICLERTRDIVFSCGHFACCSECGDTLDKCPVCREWVSRHKFLVSCEPPDNPDLIKCRLGHVVDGLIDPCGHIGYCGQCDPVLDKWDIGERIDLDVDDVEMMKIANEIQECHYTCRVCQGRIKFHCKVLWV